MRSTRDDLSFSSLQSFEPPSRQPQVFQQGCLLQAGDEGVLISRNPSFLRTSARPFLGRGERIIGVSFRESRPAEPNFRLSLTASNRTEPVRCNTKPTPIGFGEAETVMKRLSASSPPLRPRQAVHREEMHRVRRLRFCRASRGATTPDLRPPSEKRPQRLPEQVSHAKAYNDQDKDVLHAFRHRNSKLIGPAASAAVPGYPTPRVPPPAKNLPQLERIRQRRAPARALAGAKPPARICDRRSESGVLGTLRRLTPPSSASRRRSRRCSVTSGRPDEGHSHANQRAPIW
jgi:hypothetical protein